MQHVQAKTGAVFTIIMSAIMRGANSTPPTSKDLPELVVVGQEGVVSVSKPTTVVPGQYSAQVTVDGESGTADIVAKLGDLQGAITVTVTGTVNAEDSSQPVMREISHLEVRATGDSVSLFQPGLEQ